MTLTKQELKKLKGFNGTIKQTEILLNRKLSREEKVNLGLITIVPRLKLPKTSLSEIDLNTTVFHRYDQQQEKILRDKKNKRKEK
jgi:hypothetical protein